MRTKDRNNDDDDNNRNSETALALNTTRRTEGITGIPQNVSASLLSQPQKLDDIIKLCLVAIR
jgi:hypothetical protein